jgi:hypothetical protein
MCTVHCNVYYKYGYNKKRITYVVPQLNFYCYGCVTRLGAVRHPPLQIWNVLLPVLLE